MVPGVTLKERYRVGTFPLAHSGMGEVWPAQDTVLQRRVAVKVLPHANDTDAMRRFRREALLTARLSHPGVPAIFDLDQHDGHPYLVLEWIDGISLTDLAAEHHPLPYEWIVAIGAQIAAVLAAAHEMGLVHRDIKPSNAMLEPTGAVKVLDFGLAAMHGDQRYSRITQTGQSLGTIGYMAPEQINAEPTDHRTDLYGLGGVLFHLVTGDPPFDGETTMTTLRRQLTSPPPAPAVLRPDIPPALNDLIQDLLTLDPSRRPDNALDVHAALLALAGPLPPIPGVVTGVANAVRAYAAAIVAETALVTSHSSTSTLSQPAADDTPQQAERLFAAGEVRAAARLWRQLADQRAREHGDDDTQVFEWRLQAARAHIRLGERRRALRLMDALRTQRAAASGPDHPSVRALAAEIASLASPTSE